MSDLINPGFINMPEGIKFQEVFETENIEFLAQHISPQRRNACEVFDGA
jgi:hypothetical protein